MPPTFLTAIPLLAIAAAILLVYLPVGLVVYGRAQVGFDVGAPRACFSELPNYAQRAFWAHENGFETFSPFAAAALIAFVTGPHPQLVWASWTGDQALAGLSLLFLGTRVIYTLAYIANWPPLRSLAFGLGGLATMGILGISLIPLVQASGLA